MSHSLKQSTQFYINTNINIFRNELFLNKINFTTQTPKTLVKQPQTSKTNKTQSIQIINNLERYKQLNDNIEKVKKLQKPIQIIDNLSGEIKIIQNHNILNRFKKDLLDNRFISVLLTKELQTNGIFITLTTKPLNNLNLEIYELDKIYKKIYTKLKKNNIRFIKQIELTKKLIPHIHILVFSDNDKIKDIINNELNQYKYKTLIQDINQEDMTKVAYYMTKIVEQKQNYLLYYSLKQELKKQDVKLFNSSKSNIYQKRQRSPLFSAYLIHKQYIKQPQNLYDSENFMNFVLEYVKNEKKGHNNHLNHHTPHFIIDNDKIYHSTKLRVFSRFSRLEQQEIKKIQRTHKTIVDFSKLILNEIEIIIKSLKYLEYKNNPYMVFYYIVMYIINLRIIIIKPPP